MSDFLPPDVLIDIIARLPIKTIAQCACVCKSWYSLVTGPSFITTHLNRHTLSANNNNNQLILVRSYSDCSSEARYTIGCDNKKFREYTKLGFPFKSFPNKNFRVIGCCNGLICLSDDLSKYTEDLHLWNPLIQNLITLPAPVRVTFQSHGPFMHSIGFGFDPLTHDFKVVRIVYLQQDGSTVLKTPPEVDIFTLSTGTWRNIGHLDLLPYVIEKERAPQVYVKGAAHWIATDTRDQSLILSFNMGYEAFDKIMMPANMGGKEGLLDVRVAKFQESLSLIEHHSIQNGESCCVWVLEEYGAEESWSKRFTFQMRDRFRCVGFRKSGEALLATNAYPESLVLLGTKFCDAVTCEVSPVLHPEGSGA
ncbi:F-box protein At3g07870-like isoform X2 [Cornus florida]|uniref:F-box protein At3g07870-like isoform X2 n=1 Tax=Cornus florida TaxID=4283 RepID=UPI00289B3188|nr:F-box protein At3g07870-like isoform X2 [Cornus florida]